MKYRLRYAGRAGAALLFLGGALHAQQGGAAAGSEAAPRLFEPLPLAQVTRYYEDYTAIRWRNVTVDWDLLTDDGAGQGQMERLSFNLFPDVELIGSFERVEIAYGGGSVYAFQVEGDPHGSIYFSMVGGKAATATFRHRGRLYKLHHVGEGEHTVLEIDERAHRGCGTTLAEEVHGLEESPPRQGGARHHDHTVDVMVVYTDDARVANGGTAGVQSLINLAVFETNQGYANSDVMLRMNLVYCAEVDFDEDPTLSAGTYLSQLKTDGDGIIDEVHTWRDDYGADAVDMITATLPGACGVAYIMTTLGAAFEGSAFNVTADGCAVGNYSFGHEFGHNFGSAHDRDNAGSAVFDYSYGWRTTDDEYRTVMAYAPGVRILYWSNPDKESPLGLPLGFAEPDPTSAENWKSLNNVATTVSAWRLDRDYGPRVMTTFASNNQFAGNMFDVEPHTDLTVTALGLNCSAALGTAVTADVYYRTGSYVGFEGASAGWTLLGSGSNTSQGTDRVTPFSLDNCVILVKDQVYGFYVHLSSYGAGNALRYTNGGPEKYTNNFVTITTGVGKGTPAFTGSTFSFREWNGVLYYRGGDGDRSLTTLFASNNGFAGNMFNVTAARDVTLNSFDVNIEAFGTVATADVWYRAGGYTGFESDPYEWTFLGTDMKALVETAGADLPTRISVGNLDLSAGSTVGLYVNLNSYESASQRLLYTNGSDTYTDGVLTVDTGVGKGNAAFTGSTFADRSWNGTINYSIDGLFLDVAGLVANSTATITVLNATPDGDVRLWYSVRGAGPTNVTDPVCGAVTLALRAPLKSIGVFTADACGTLTLSTAVPAGTTGVQVWADALDRGTCTTAGGFTAVIG